MYRAALSCFAALLVLASAACGPDHRTFDSAWPDVSRDDARGEVDGGGTEDGTGDGAGDVDGDAPPLPRETEDNDPFHGGVAETLATPATLQGDIGFPTADRPDWDVFAVDGHAGDLLRVSVFPVTGYHADYAVRIVRRDATGTIVWERDGDDPAGSSVYRDAFLPADGTYLVIVSDRANFLPSPAAWVGGADYGYQLGVSLFGPPTELAAGLPWTWNGAIPTAGLIQAVTVTPAAGTRVEALLHTSDGVVFDPLLTVFDADAGRVIAEDDDAAGGYDALARLDASGGRLIFVIDHASLGTGGPAALQLALRALDPTAEAEPNDGAASADRLDVGTTVQGTIDAPAGTGGAAVEDRDLFVFDAVAGQSYAVDVRRDGGASSALDPSVAVLRPLAGSGRLVAETPLAFADDCPTRAALDAHLVLTARRDGALYAEVRDARNVAAERAGAAPADGGPLYRYLVALSVVAAPSTVDLGTPSPAVVRDGVVAAGGVPDAFRFAAADGTPALFALDDLAPAGEPFAPVAWVADAAGAVGLLALAPPAGGGIDGGAFVAGAGGWILVGDALGSGGTAFLYRLGVRVPAADAATETTAANDTLAAAQPLSWDAARDGVVVAGFLDASGGTGPDAVDVYRVDVAPDARVVAFTGPLGGEAVDTALALRSADGTVLAGNDDAPGGETAWSSVAATAGADGAVFVEVAVPVLTRDGAGGYRLFVGTP